MEDQEVELHIAALSQPFKVRRTLVGGQHAANRMGDIFILSGAVDVALGAPNGHAGGSGDVEVLRSLSRRPEHVVGIVRSQPVVPTVAQ